MYMQKETDELHNMLQDPEWRKELHAKFTEDKERSFSPVLKLEEVAKDIAWELMMPHVMAVAAAVALFTLRAER